jgi:uncharacterized membrane protein
MSLGPLQVLVVNFGEAHFAGEIEAELRRLEDAGIVRTLDVLVVAKSPEGDVEVVRTGEQHSGALGGALLGIGTTPDQDVEAAELLDVADAIEPGGAAAIAVLEHRWAVPLYEAIERAGGSGVATEWADADALARMGVPITS